MDNKKRVLEARSKRNGIVFYSNKNPLICYEVYINEKGEIQKEKIPREVSEGRDNDAWMPEYSVKLRRIEKILKVVMAVVGIISIIIIKKISIAIGLMYFSMIALRDFLRFVELSYQLKCGEKQPIARFHAAEHMVLNAYERKQRIPTIEEIKKASRFDRNCSSKTSINKIFIFGIMSAVICLSGSISIYSYFILIIAVIIFNVIQQRYNILKFLQVFVTKKPSNKEIEVALEGIKFFEEMEEQIPELFKMGGILICFRCDNKNEK